MLHFEFTPPSFHKHQNNLFNSLFPHPYTNMKAEKENPIRPTTSKSIYSCPCFNIKYQNCGERGVWGKSRSKNNNEHCMYMEDLVKTHQQLPPWKLPPVIENIKFAQF